MFVWYVLVGVDFCICMSLYGVCWFLDCIVSVNTLHSKLRDWTSVRATVLEVLRLPFELQVEICT